MQNDRKNNLLHDSLADLIGRLVVLDTPGTIVYLGQMTDVDETGIWLEDADVHDCSEGHAGKEFYVIESAHYGIHVNRRRAFVLRGSIISVSALEDVVTDISDDREFRHPIDVNRPPGDDDTQPIPLE